MSNPKYQTRLPADTAEQVDEYIDEHEISQAEAVRRLVVAGIEAERAAKQTAEQQARDEIDSEAVSVAEMDPRVRLAGGVLIGAMVLFLFLSEVGLL